VHHEKIKAKENGCTFYHILANVNYGSIASPKTNRFVLGSKPMGVSNAT
jgi:hypothetical protein